MLATKEYIHNSPANSMLLTPCPWLRNGYTGKVHFSSRLPSLDRGNPIVTVGSGELRLVTSGASVTNPYLKSFVTSYLISCSLLLN
jgi:hypothetical protein